MICNKCLVQMNQKDKIGCGRAEEKEYMTWELKECPACGRKVVEYYAAIEVTSEQEILIREAIEIRAQKHENEKRV